MRRPNILILYTDQQRWDALGANGNAEIQTPNLDRLATEGVNFDRCFVQNPVCMPSRLSFLTGQYPSNLGVTHMGVPVPEDTITLPRMLQPYGYVSANIGKLHFLPHANRDHRVPYPSYGFDRLEISDEPGCYEDAYRAWVRRVAPDQLDAISVGLPPAAAVWQKAIGFEDTVVHPPERFPKRALAFRGRSDVTHTAFVAEQTIEFLRTRPADQPWLCIAGFYSPHSPWVAPQEFLDRYDPQSLSPPLFPEHIEAERQASGAFSDEELRSARQGYYAMVSEVDHHVGRILAALEEHRLAEDTIIVFTSDHGEWLGEHLRYGKGFPGLDQASHVPLIIRWPAGRLAARTVSDIVEAVDVVPTLLACAGIQVPPHVDGESLLPLLGMREGREPARTKDVALVEHTGWRNLRTDRHRYICCADGREFLYDLERDPSEYFDVSRDPSYRDTLSELRGRMARRLVEIQRPKPRVWNY